MDSANSRRLFLGVFIGVLLVQAAWLFVVPPFRGLDEHDHAYKAAAVARGDWSPDHATSSQGWGDFVVVPEDLVLAATPVCEALPYTTPDNCNPGEDQGDGLVRVASSAARYNPAFYFVIGTAARPFSGAHALYAMRVTACLMSALLIAAAVVTTSLWARTRWPFVALLLASTPVLIYSTSMATPNGLEMASAMLVWSALLGLARAPHGRYRNRFVVLATLGALPLTTVRGLGPLWCVLIVLVAATLMRREDLRVLARLRTLQVGVVTIGATAALSIAWTLSAHTNSFVPNPKPLTDSPLDGIPKEWILWFLQSIAAFPARDELSPVSLYAIALVAWWVVVAIFWRFATWRERGSVLLVVAIASAIPIAVTMATYRDLGTAWQGRYGYPFAMGFMLIAGYVLDRRWPSESRLPTVAVWVAAAACASTEAIGQLAVLADQLKKSPLAGDPEWIVAPAPVVLALILAGSLLQAVVMTRARPLGQAVSLPE